MLSVEPEFLDEAEQGWHWTGLAACWHFVVLISAIALKIGGALVSAVVLTLRTQCDKGLFSCQYLWVFSS